MEATGRPKVMGRGRGRARPRSPPRDAIPESPTGSQSPDRESCGASVTVVEKDLEALAVGTSSSSPSPQTGGPVIENYLHLVDDDSTSREKRSDVDCPTTQPEGKEAVVANYYELKRAPKWALYEYHVEILPEVDRPSVSKTLFKKAIADADMQFGYIFDGIMLHTPIVLGTADEALILPVEDTVEKIQRQVVIKLVSEVANGKPAYANVYNLLFRKCMFALGLVEMGASFFDPEAAVDISAHCVTLWPGYAYSIRPRDDKMFLCVEMTAHEVLRMDSVLGIIKDLETNSGSDQEAFRAAVKKELANTMVMTTYNKNAYEIEDVRFNLNPQSMMFENRKDERKALVDYYKDRYNLIIKDLNQPLLKAKPNKRGLQGGRDKLKLILLLPELCQSIGITDNMRANVALMKELNKFLDPAPEVKSRCLDGLDKRMRENETMKTELLNWGMELDEKLV